MVAFLKLILIANGIRCSTPEEEPVILSPNVMAGVYPVELDPFRLTVGNIIKRRGYKQNMRRNEGFEGK